MKKSLMIILINLSLISMAYSAECIGNIKSDCLSCHKEYKDFSTSPMATKAKEKAFTSKTVDMFDPDFSKKNCSSCHISSCTDCHKSPNGKVSKPETNDCLSCHRDGFTGGDYVGMGIREDHERYRRGPKFMGENYMLMTPDIHFEKEMTCGSCHSMKNMLGKEKAKSCLSCHKYDKSIIDHSVNAHDKVACVSCHAAWAPMELGTFFIRTRESSYKEHFSELKVLNDEYTKSSFMRVNDRPPLGIDNNTGLYTPIKPSFIIFTTSLYKNLVVGAENQMISNRWKVFTPHTIRRETPLCNDCHNNEARFMAESDSKRVLMPDKDGLPFKSFYNKNGFTLLGGRFLTDEEVAKINQKTPLYIKKYFLKLDQLKNTIKKAIIMPAVE